MINKANELERYKETEMHGGKGAIEVIIIHSQENQKNSGIIVAKVIFPPGSSAGQHEQEEDEIYYLTKGSALVNEDGNETELGVGDVHIKGKNIIRHGIKNIGDEKMEMIAVKMLI